METTATSLLVPQSGGVRRALRIFVTELRFDLLRMSRTRTFSLSVLGFPVMFYVLFGLVLNRGAHVGGMSLATYLLGSYAVFGCVGASLFGVGVGLAADRSAGWLELKQASPMPPLAYLLARCCTAIVFGLVITCLLSVLGIAFGHVVLTAAEFTRMMMLTAVGCVPFGCMGLLIAMVVPANSAPGVTNMLYLPMSFLGGLWLPMTILPKVLQSFAPVLPTYQLGQIMIGALGFPEKGSAVSHWSGLLGFTLVMLGAAWIAFRRSGQNV